ncbi:C-type lectin domain family 4 member F-like isoform X1 [Malaclemys terrapin pileata]|uniref:C-type lectin domain family 4 member F-like isoform X1 n=1 Tax=Malaclemys terrapin pileata TaxID=2991368 RepID=UPI0023A82014|nr:C-type lectin domain family 4 member F-like isoform X1 [Malaclemys terrapin pileata]
MRAGKEENAYENVTRVIPSRQLGEGKLLETSQKREVIIRVVLILLSLSLGASFVTMTIMYHRELREKHQVAEAFQKIKVSLKLRNVSYSSALEQNGLPLLDQLQLLMEEVGTSCTTMRKQYSDVLTKLPRGWRFYGGNLYYFSQEKKSWDEAERFCVSQDLHLTSVSSQAEQEFLSKETKGEDHWIGLTDRGTEGSWRWVDGTEYREDTSRGFWEENQPDNWDQGIGSREDCVHIHPRNGNLWNDANCALPSRWICKQAHGLAGL